MLSALVVALLRVSASAGAPATSTADRTPAGSTPANFNHHHAHRGSRGLHYTISGDASRLLYPGTSTTIDLSFTNPNVETITVPAGAVSITLHSPRPDCPVNPNFKVVQTLTIAVTIPGNSTRTLSGLGVPPRSWPVIKMMTTRGTQDACAGMTYRIHYSVGEHHGH